jgi:hypothetical protein
MKALHRLLVVISLVPLALAFAFLAIFAGFALLADKAMPHARWGNCWTYAVPRWLKYGGYLSLRRSDGVALFGRVGIPHAVWQSSLRGGLRMTAPVKRKSGLFFPVHVMLFDFTVWHGDGLHEADWSPSSTPPAWQATQAPKG